MNSWPSRGHQNPLAPSTFTQYPPQGEKSGIQTLAYPEAMVAPHGEPNQQTTRGSSNLRSQCSLLCLRSKILYNVFMNLAFFGDDQYSTTVLHALFKFPQTLQKHPLKLIITTRPKPKGRKQETTPPPVEIFAKAHNILTLYYSTNSNDSNNICNTLNKYKITLGILASFGHILPPRIINSFEHGIINLHPSLLPQFRGATPIQHAIALGYKTTGITLFRLDSGVDTGPIIAQQSEPILPTDDTPTLTARLFTHGTKHLVQHFKQPGKNPTIKPRPPDEPLIYTARFTRQSGFVQWSIFTKTLSKEPIILKNLDNPLLKLRYQHNPPIKPITALHDLVRALTPWPGVWTLAPTKKGDKRLKILSVKPDFLVQLEGKPQPIPWEQFQKYHLSTPIIQ